MSQRHAETFGSTKAIARRASDNIAVPKNKTRNSGLKIVRLMRSIASMPDDAESCVSARMTKFENANSRPAIIAAPMALAIASQGRAV